VALKGNELVRAEQDNPVRIYLGLRRLLYQFADQYHELNNECSCRVMCPYTQESEVRSDYQPVIYEGDSVARALVGQSMMPGMQVGVRVYLNLPHKPAIQIGRRVASTGARKDNRPITVEQTLYLVDGRWYNNASPQTPHTEYRLLATILHRSSDNRHALIARDDRDEDDSDLALVERKEWVLLEPEAHPSILKNGAARKLIDGDGTDGYNAVLALYKSVEIARPGEPRADGGES
jgi:hypothetical protein